MRGETDRADVTSSGKSWRFGQVPTQSARWGDWRRKGESIGRKNKGRQCLERKALGKIRFVFGSEEGKGY